MNLNILEQTLLSKNATTKEFPFGDDVIVFKVMNKMFALIPLDDDTLRINLKCDPQDALAYRDIYKCVKAGYHMNKKHWNTVTLDGSMKDEILVDMINDSYNLVVAKLTKKEKIRLKLVK